MGLEGPGRGPVGPRFGSLRLSGARLGPEPWRGPGGPEVD